MVHRHTDGDQKKRVELENLKTMYSLGLTLGDAEILGNYEECGWFFQEALEIQRKRETSKLIQLAEAVRMGTIGAKTQEGYAVYKTWLLTLQDSIKEKEISGEETLFDKLKKQPKKKKVLTFWESMKKKR